MNPELTSNSVRPDMLTEDDRATYTEGIRDVIDLDAVVVAAAGNINVMSILISSDQDAERLIHTIEINRLTIRASRLHNIQHCLGVNCP